MKIFKHRKKNVTRTSHTGSSQVEQYDNNTHNLTRGGWHHTKHWYHQRPCWGAFCVLSASLLILWAPICLLQNGIVPASTQWAGLLIGGLLFAMGLIELFAPSNALTAGAIGIVLALISLITTLGGFGIGMILAMIGSSYAIAWKPERKTASRPVFWSILGGSIAILSGMIMLVMRGTLAVAEPMVVPYTAISARTECHGIHSIPAISRVDHRTVVELAHSDYCVSSNNVTIQHVLGRTITITTATTISRGVTTETVASHTDVAHDTDTTVSAANGLESDTAVDASINTTVKVLYSNAESATSTDVTLSIS